MATITTKTGDTKYVLELDEAEAAYVYAALHHIDPAHAQFGGDVDFPEDPVYDALGEAFSGTGADYDLSAAKVIA